MLHRVLVFAAFGCCVLVLASFALFARDQVSAGSKHQVSELAGGAAPGGQPAAPHKEGQPRRFIDGAASTLTSPFKSIVQSDSQWVVRGMPTLFALLVYGLGLGYLARYTKGFS